MSSVNPAVDDTITTELLQQLLHTPYACLSLSPPLSSRPGNFVYRGILARPIHAQDGTMARSIIVKHCADRVPKIFEELLLHLLANFSISTTITTVRTPRLFLYDRETNTQVLEDFSNTYGFKTMFSSLDPQNYVPSLRAATIGRQLGFWLRSFHTWSSAPEQAALRAQMWRNDSMRKTKHVFTYDGVIRVIKNFPELSKDHEKSLVTISNELAKGDEGMFDKGCRRLRSSTWRFLVRKVSQNPNQLFYFTFVLIYILHDSILLGNTGRREPPLPGWTNDLFIIDWEFSHFGHLSCDLGQIVGDLYERQIYSNLNTAKSIMNGVIDGYGTLSEDMAFRTAIYVGVHLITWYNRRPRKALNETPPDVIISGLTIGRDFMLKGWAKDKDFFRDSALASLFAAR